MIFYVIAFLCLIGGLNATGNDQCVVPVFCPKDGRRGWLAVPNIEKLPSSVFCPNTCPLREACKEKMDETRKVLDHDLNTLAKEFTEMNELLKKKMACGPLYNRSSDGSVCRDNPTARADRCEWTDWYSRDHPGGYEDNEPLSELRKENPGKICAIPTCIQARVLSTEQPYNTTGDIVHISPCIGFQCVNAEQHGCATPRTCCCQDYEVRFCCPTDFKWNGKYFWARIPADKITYTQAVAECMNSKGSGNAHPANIYDEMHYKNITKYLRTQITRNRWFWLGMTYNNTDDKLYLNNGTEAKYRKWRNGYPKAGTMGSHIALEVKKNKPTNEDCEGMIFTGDDARKRYGVLCEEE